MSLRTLKNLLIVATLALTMAGCSSSPTAPNTFTQTVNGTVNVFGFTAQNVTSGINGTLTLALTWADPTVDLDLFLTTSSCTDITTQVCTILGQSTASVGTSENISRAVTNGQVVTMWVLNFSTTKSQAYSIAVKIQ